MTELMSRGLALVAVALFGLALLLLSEGNLSGSGLSFLGASLVIYFRETRTGGE